MPKATRKIRVPKTPSIETTIADAVAAHVPAPLTDEQAARLAANVAIDMHGLPNTGDAVTSDTTADPVNVEPLAPSDDTVAPPVTADPLAPIVTGDASTELVATPAPAPSYRGATRDASGIVRQATNFEQLSNRDDAYFAFFASVAALHNGTATLVQLHSAGCARDDSTKRYNPLYAGSAKATDIGAYNRLIKAGRIRFNADGTALSVTERGESLSLYARYIPLALAPPVIDPAS